MAGSYNHAVDKDGKLDDFDIFKANVENLGDAYETVEEMYGMIWFLAHALRNTRELAGQLTDHTEAQLVELARANYSQGVQLSPTDRPAQF